MKHVNLYVPTYICIRINFIKLQKCGLQLTLIETYILSPIKNKLGKLKGHKFKKFLMYGNIRFYVYFIYKINNLKFLCKVLNVSY